MSSTSEDVLDWLYTVALERARRQVPVTNGVAVLDSDFPVAHDHNQLVLRSGADMSIAAAEAESVLGAAGVAHRQIAVLGADLGELPGYERTSLIVLDYRGEPPPPVETAIDTLSVAERVAAASQGWRERDPDAPADVADQLGRRIQTILPVVTATFLGVRGAEGEVAATLDLYLRGGIAQIENLITMAAQRNKGFATALVRTAIQRAGTESIFLIADAEDWPVAFYRRLGFVDLCPITEYLRIP